MLQVGAHAATIIASVVAVGALLAGLYQFSKTQELTQQTLRLQKAGLEFEKQSKAIDLVLKFNEIQESLSMPARRRSKEMRFWRQNLALTTAESVFDVVGANPQWKATVGYMLREQKEFLIQYGLDCPTFGPEFIHLVEAVIATKVCR